MQAVQWTGDNFSELQAVLSDSTLAENEDGTITVTGGAFGGVLHPNDWWSGWDAIDPERMAATYQQVSAPPTVLTFVIEDES